MTNLCGFFIGNGRRRLPLSAAPKRGSKEGAVIKKIVTSRKGRKCKHPRCKHILSIYNHEAYCHIHAGSAPLDQGSRFSKMKRGGLG
ncbi:MAG: hypothetical protein Q8Q08_06950 [Candidatus Omnitrophota bacterium]|nr:hypothetical protein [Candidatus Omnitrophota bacterium]